MKVVLPLAGKGTRLLPHTLKTPKPLMEVAGKSILAHLMDELITLNPSEFVFIVGYLKEQIVDFIKTNYPKIPVRFVEQVNPQGLGHAILCAQPAFTSDEPMLVILGDQTFTIPWDKMLEPSSNRISTFAVEDASSFGVVLADASGRILEMEEKPAKPKSNTIISGTYFFPSAQKVFQTLEKQVAKDIRTRGEIQITDTMRLMMEEQIPFMALPIKDWNDCGNHADLIRANEVLIAKQQKKTLIDPSALVENSQLGANVSVGAKAVVKNCVLSNTVVCAGVQLENCTLEDCYITENMSGETHQKLYR
ncbi:MAG: sugar phosphate nucleotidyltransferase [Brevinema sp.]